MHQPQKKAANNATEEAADNAGDSARRTDAETAKATEDADAPKRAVPEHGSGTSDGYDYMEGQGLYILRDKEGVIRYAGIGDVPNRRAAHARALRPLKSPLLYQSK